ncbi:MAG: ABC transporter substrate-binding protein [Thermodesulfobacteriota bacterium]
MKSTRELWLSLWRQVLLLPIVMGLGSLPAQAFTPLQADFSTYDAKNQVFPTGDTIKVGLFEPFSGQSASAGEISAWLLGWVVHDINSQGGIMVDGKMKKIQVIKADTATQPVVAKRALQRLILNDKVDLFVGTAGSHIALIGNQMAGKYKKIFLNYSSYSVHLMDAQNFNRYTFRTCSTTDINARALAYYFSKTPIRKFYILCQDYSYGHDFGKSIKKAMEEFLPDADIVGEVYHPLWLKDFAPYLSKIQASGAEMILSSDWPPDSWNLMLAMDQMGMNIPVGGQFFDDPRMSQNLKNKNAGVGNTVVNFHLCNIKSELNERFNTIFHNRYKDSPDIQIEWPTGVIGGVIGHFYWLFDVIQRAGTLNPEKIIATWEGDTYETFSGTLFMRKCDHQAVMDMYLSTLVSPSRWSKGGDRLGYQEEAVRVPSSVVMSPCPEGLEP